MRCGKGQLVLTRLQPAGRKALDVAEFLRGYPVDEGESLASTLSGKESLEESQG